MVGRSWLREPFSGGSHLIGAGVALAGAIALSVRAGLNAAPLMSVLIYGLSLVVLYLASGLYHSLHASERAQRRLQKVDHTAIYLLIAGTYVPICVLGLADPLRTFLLVLQWSLALLGVLAVFAWNGGPSWLRLALYIVMGWIATAFWGQLGFGLGPVGLIWLLAGGVVYTVGAVFYALDRPRLFGLRFSSHDLWHLFVIGGSACHFVVVWRLLPG